MMVQAKHHIDLDFPMCIVSSLFTIGLVGVALYYAILGMSYLLNYFLLSL